MTHRPLLSICIPAYNRSRFLRPLLDSILSQNFSNYEIVVCEDNSPERNIISSIILEYQENHIGIIKYFNNAANLGYDGNIRKLIEKSTGEFCFFMGNDDLMCEGALEEVARIIRSRENIGMILKSYSWFDVVPENVVQTVNYFTEERVFKAGKQAIHACFRRSGVIAGYIINRDAAFSSATTKFDGSLYYQMHLTASVLLTMNAVFTPKVLVLCRSGQPPDFGNSSAEIGKYTPGSFTAEARLNMVNGSLSIIKNLKNEKGIDLVDEVMRDYANYFYPCIKDQLQQPFVKYWNLYIHFARMGFYRYPMFHIYIFVAYILGEKRFDWVVKSIKNILGRSPNFGH